MTPDQQRIAVDNLRLCRFVLRRRRIRPDSDRLQEARIGLCESVVAYDPTRAKLSTFACRKIAWNVLGYLRAEGPWAKVWKGVDLDGIGVEHDWPDLDSGDMVGRLMRSLNDRQKLVISMRYLEGRTLQETGKAMKVTRERVRQIELNALRKLREAAERLQATKGT